MLTEALWILYGIATLIIMVMFGAAYIVPAIIIGLLIDDAFSYWSGGPRQFR